MTDFPPNPLLAEQFAAIARRLAAERKAAAVNVERLLNKTPREAWPSLAHHPDLSTSGALERLGKIFDDHYGSDPTYSLNIAELAVAVAEALPQDSYPNLILVQTLAAARRDLGRAYRAFARNLESLEVLTSADTLLASQAALAHDHALVRLNIAITLQELERYKESRKLLAHAKAIFREYGDTRRLTNCTIAEGVLLQRLKQFREAREVYLVLLSSTMSTDAEALAALHQAVGFCSIDLLDYQTAEANLEKALALNRQLGKTVEIMKVELGRGRLFTHTGQYQRAIDHLRPVRRQFLASGMVEEAGLCGLEAVEAMLALGKSSQAETLARRIVVEFTKAGLNTRAVAALGYLADAITSRAVPPTLVTQVQDYIVSLRRVPERDFTYHS